MEATVGHIGEGPLLKRLRQFWGPGPKDLLVPNGDDAAVIPARGPLVVSTDAVIADIHYHADRTPPESIARKAMTGALSDLAAKAADPYAVLITLAIPLNTRVSWVATALPDIGRVGETWGAPVIGGDVVRSPHVAIDVVAMGWLTTDKPITIGGARPGDAILITGSVGAARLGLHAMEGLVPSGIPDHTVENAKHWFLRPEPRLAQARKIVAAVMPTAMTDVSDGLARDLPKLANASGVGFHVSLDSIPSIVDSQLGRIDAWMGGEDYELLLTLPAAEAERLLKEWDDEVPLTKIGEVVSKDEGQNVEGLPEKLDGFDHFRQEGA